jgi:hypothetical protein
MVWMKRGSSSRFRLDAAAHAADHAVDVGVVDIALCFGPHGLGNLIFADDAVAILVEKPEQIKLFDAEGRVKRLAVDIDLARGDVDAQPRFADRDQRRARSRWRRGRRSDSASRRICTSNPSESQAVLPGARPLAVDEDAVFALQIAHLVAAVEAQNFGVLA